MPAYKYQLKTGKTKWYANFYYEDWTGTRQHKCKRGFDTKKEANEYERLFLDKFSKSPTILFSSLVDNYLDDMKTRIKPTTIKNKEYLIRTKLVPYFGKLQICDIDAEVIRKWQNVLIEYRDKKGKPYAETYLYTINAQLSAIMNYAVKFYRLQINPCFIAGYIGKNKASEMKIWTHDQFKQALEHEKKIAYTIAFKILFYGGIREGELLALTPDDIPRDEAMIDINKNYAVVDRVEYFLTPKTERSVRIGALITKNAEVRSAVMKFCQARLSPPLIGQIAAEASLDASEEYARETYDEYVERRKCLIDGLNRIPGVYSPIPMGAFYTVAKLPVDDADKFCAWCLEEFEYEGQTVMMAPASGFYTTPGLGKNEVRMAYVLKKEDLAKALTVLSKALEAYPGRML